MTLFTIKLINIFGCLGILFAIFLGYRVIRRMRQDSAKENEGLDWITGGFVSLVIVAFSLLFFIFFSILIESTTTYVGAPRYESTVVDINSSLVERRVTDTNGHEGTKEVMMHTAIIEFTDENQKLIRRFNNVSSGKKPNLGDKITVSYKDGELQEFSFRSIGLYILLCIFLLIVGFLLNLIYNFSVRKSNERILQLAGRTCKFIFAPSLLIFVFAHLSYALFEFFSGNRTEPHPLAFLVSVGFIWLILLLTGIVYSKIFLLKKK